MSLQIKVADYKNLTAWAYIVDEGLNKYYAENPLLRQEVGGTKKQFYEKLDEVIEGLKIDGNIDKLVREIREYNKDNIYYNGIHKKASDFKYRFNVLV